MFKDNWLQEGPTLKELANLVKDERKAENDVAIIMPSFRGKEKLGRHMQYLKEQTFQDFDLIIVYGPDDELIENTEEFSLAHIRRNNDYGSAGGFYTGERFVLEEDYKYLILADDDCFPIDKKLVGNIVKVLKENQVVVFPTADVGDSNFITHLMGFYAGVRTDSLYKAGLSWMPFYYYCEDLEWHNRLNIYAKNVIIPSKVVHETRQIYFFSERAYYVVRNSLMLEFMMGKKRVFFTYLYVFMTSGFSFYLLDQPRSRYLLQGIADFVSGRMFRGNYKAVRYEQDNCNLPTEAIGINYEHKNEIMRKWKTTLGAFNKKIFTNKANFTGWWVIFLYLLSSELFVVDKKEHVIYQGRTGFLNKIAFVLLLPLIVTGSLTLTIIIFLYSHLFVPYRSKKNIKYGVPKQR
ncbi:glycosyltransferase [Candidatus Micrarchaeota archaeon]|nr:glycosyltransferase [Candidatus Micrarchaeota archaeon]